MFNYTCKYTQVYLHLYEYFYNHTKFVLHTIIWVLILRCTYTFKSVYTRVY